MRVTLPTWLTEIEENNATGKTAAYMRTWLTSDLHLGHANIIRYCGRPFRDIQTMNDRIIQNWNSRVKPEDVVYNLGDFCFHRGAEGQKITAEHWESRLNGKIIHIMGNHDRNNGIRGLSCGILWFARKNIFLTHRPPEFDQIPNCVDLVVCGHIHERWKYRVSPNGIPIINCGVDVWSFRPVMADELIGLYGKIVRNSNTGMLDYRTVMTKKKDE